jgi:solute carrier family 25 carnitine/acylcarnitine transporter 20/29
MQLQSKGIQTLYDGSIDCLIKICKNSGLKGLYRGSLVTILRDSIGGLVFLLLYEHLLNNSIAQYGRRDNIPMMHIALFGALSGIAEWCSIYPLDAIKTNIQSSSLRHPFNSSQYLEAVRLKGFRGLYSGFMPCIIKAPISNAAVFIGYELACRLYESFI